MSFTDEFIQFLEEYGIIGLAIAFVIGVAVKDLVTATVNALIMPVIGVFLPAGVWQNATVNILGIEFLVGIFLSALIDFTIIALLIFIFVRYVLRKN